MPENVRDRDELLLNAIVTGDTSGIDPRDREETFIKAIAEKRDGPFYPAGTGYTFYADGSGNITGVYDGMGQPLDLDKIKPADLIGEVIGIGFNTIGSVISMYLIGDQYVYNTVYTNSSVIEFYTATLDIANKTISYSKIIEITP